MADDRMHSRAAGRPGRRPGWIGARWAALLLAVAWLAPALALAEPAADAAKPAATLDVELNKLEPQPAACRAYVVFHNKSARAYTALRLDLIFFGTDGVVARRLAVDVGALAARKTAVRLFDLDGLSCDGIGQILLNDIPVCDGAQDAAGGCLSGVAVSSRVSRVPFVQ